SIAGVETMPTSVHPVVPPHPCNEMGTGVTFCGRKLVCHSGLEFLPVALSASNAYTLLCIVATYTTLCTPRLGIVTEGRYRACPVTAPSTLCVYSFPNDKRFTFWGVRIISFVLAPECALSKCHVVTGTCAFPTVITVIEVTKKTSTLRTIARTRIIKTAINHLR